MSSSIQHKSEAASLARIVSSLRVLSRQENGGCVLFCWLLAADDDVDERRKNSRNWDREQDGEATEEDSDRENRHEYEQRGEANSTAEHARQNEVVLEQSDDEYGEPCRERDVP